MGVTCFREEFKSPIAPSRLFKAMALDAHNLLPKIAPQVISAEFTEGSGGVGSIKKFTFAEETAKELVSPGAYKWLKQRVDVLDSEILVHKYTVIESDPAFDKIEKIVYETKFEASGDGSICNAKFEYYSKEGMEINEDEIKSGKEKVAGIRKIVEDYLLSNPEYA